MKDEKKIKEKHTPNLAENAEGKSVRAFAEEPCFYRPQSAIIVEEDLTPKILQCRLVNQPDTHG